MQNTPTIGFIGAGNMAYALVSGLINHGYASERIVMSDANETLLSLRQDEFSLRVFKDNQQLAQHCDVIVLAVKPQVLAEVCAEIKDQVSDQQLLVSIAAGVHAHDINRWLGKNKAIVRTMPNTPALLGRGITGLFANEHTSSAQQDIAQHIMSAVGKTLWVDSEDLLDAVTAVSGSGPAYFFLMVESMTKAGEALGLTRDAAEQLSIETALGAALMASESSDSPRELRRQVTSPNGTTQAAIESFQDQDFEVIVSHALSAAYHRAGELGAELGDQ